MDSKVRYLRNPLCAGRVISGEAFVVTPGDNKLHRLNQTATCIWNSIANEAKSIDQLVEDILGEFDVEKERAVKDSQVCITDFIKRKIIVVKEHSD